MTGKIELIRKVNSCLVGDSPLDPPHVDELRLHETLSDNEISQFMDCLNSDPPTVQAYRSKFYVLEYKKNKDFNHRYKCITVMRDDEGEIHSIIADGCILWTAEPEG